MALEALELRLPRAAGAPLTRHNADPVAVLLLVRPADAAFAVDRRDVALEAPEILQKNLVWPLPGHAETVAVLLLALRTDAAVANPHLAALAEVLLLEEVADVDADTDVVALEQRQTGGDAI